MLNFLEVVWQHILGVVGNVIQFSIANLTDFPAVKEFWKSVKINNKIIVTRGWHIFGGHSVCM